MSATRARIAFYGYMYKQAWSSNLLASGTSAGRTPDVTRRFSSRSTRNSPGGVMSRTTSGLAPRPAANVDLTPAFRWPAQDFFPRGPPRRVATKFTTYGYEITLVKQQGGHYTQEARPSVPAAARPRPRGVWTLTSRTPPKPAPSPKRRCGSARRRRRSGSGWCAPSAPSTRATATHAPTRYLDDRRRRTPPTPLEDRDR